MESEKNRPSSVEFILGKLLVLYKNPLNSINILLLTREVFYHDQNTVSVVILMLPDILL